MNIRSGFLILILGVITPLYACAQGEDPARMVFEPREVIDLGMVVTEDLPEQFWGKAFLDMIEPMGFDRQNTFDVIPWEFGGPGGPYFGSNAYYEFFNHGGPHIDAPNHVSVGGGLDSYPIEVFSGPVKVFDARDYPNGRSIPEELFRGSVNAGDVVLVFTDFQLPQAEGALPELATLTPAAAEYLATLPVRAFGTDAFSVDTSDPTPFEGESATAMGVPIHYTLLSRAIPVYEQLQNVDRLLDRSESDAMYFVGVPLNIKDGDGMLVRPVVFLY